MGNKTTGVRLRIVLQPGVALGPGKADLLEGISATGSIAAAGRGLGMSYKRAWGLVEEMNRDFRKPVVATNKGGKSFGGATLTQSGERVLNLYRTIEERAETGSRTEVRALRRLLNDITK